MKQISLLLLFTLILGSCKDKEVINETVDLNPEGTANTCQIVSNTRHTGITYGFNYEGSKIIGMTGFSDFDTFEYDGVTLTKAFNSRDDSYEVHFEYNSNGQLTEVIFNGKDSQGRLFSNASKLTYNAKNDISQLLFNWPTFDRVACFLNYDDNGNVLNISGEYQGRLQNFLINNTFDDKKSPYKDQKIGQVLTYFMIYGLLVGGENLTYYLNNNNVTSSTINVNNLTKKVGWEYLYNGADYPKEANMTINQNNKIKLGTEYFEYKCGN